MPLELDFSKKVPHPNVYTYTIQIYIYTVQLKPSFRFCALWGAITHADPLIIFFYNYNHLTFEHAKK